VKVEEEKKEAIQALPASKKTLGTLEAKKQ
jgi:hypothetical protein